MDEEIERVHAIKHRAKSLKITGDQEHQEAEVAPTLRQRINRLYNQIERGFAFSLTQLKKKFIFAHVIFL